MEPRALCPICNKYWAQSAIEDHAWQCTGDSGPSQELVPPDLDPGEDILKCFICNSTEMGNLHALEVRDHASASIMAQKRILGLSEHSSRFQTSI
jgi:hypothetical protein